MKIFSTLMLGVSAAAMAVAHAPSRANGEKAAIGAVTPSWNLTDSAGTMRKIEDYRGKFVVLEWTNAHCPFVRRHYESGNMQATQQKAVGLGAVWFTINTSAPGNQGYMTSSQINAYRNEMKVKSTATLIDSDGTVGHIYGAKTTPQVVVIDPKGVVIYNGAIDDKPSTDVEDNATATNYVLAALHEAMAGKAVSVPSTRSYGCAIKYSRA